MSSFVKCFDGDFHWDFMKRQLEAWWLQRPVAVSSHQE